MVGGDRVDRAVDDAGDERLGVRSGAQRRVNLEAGVVGTVDGVLGEEHVMRGGLAGHGQALGLGGADHLQALGGGDVLDVQLGTGELGDHDVAHDLELLALRRPAEQTEAGGNGTLVDLAVADQVVVLAVAHEDLAEHLAIVHGATQHASALDAVAVIGEGDAAVLDHVAHLGDDLALEATGHGAGGVHAAVALGGGDGLDVLDHDAVVGDGVGVGHGAHAGEATLGGSGGLGLDVALGLEAGLTQVDVHIHQAGNEVYTSVKLDRRVDDVGILKKQGHYRHLQAADTGQPCARRYRRTPGRG